MSKRDFGKGYFWGMIFAGMILFPGYCSREFKIEELTKKVEQQEMVKEKTEETQLEFPLTEETQLEFPLRAKFPGYSPFYGYGDINGDGWITKEEAEQQEKFWRGKL